MTPKEPHVLVSEGQRISRETFDTKAAADAAAAKLNEAKLRESAAKQAPLVESKQILLG